MSLLRLLLLPLAILALLVLLGLVSLSSPASAHVCSGGQRTSLPPGTNTGTPAITPECNAAIAVSVSDVQTYIQAHGFVGGAVIPYHTLHILSIQLMTPQQADAQGAELDGYTATTMVYVVKMVGPFYTTHEITLVGGPSTSLVGDEIFDAHTGNMLEWGAAQSINDGI